MKEKIFKYLQYCTKNKLTICEESALSFDKDLNNEQIVLLNKESSTMLMSILFEGGIIYDDTIQNFNNIEDYLKSIQNNIKQRRKNELDSWIQNSPSRKFFSERKPKNKEEENLFDQIEESIEIINEYWDITYFNEKELAKQLICICERDYGGENRIGILVKQEPYAHQYRVIVRGITGPYNIANDGNGWSLEMEKGSKRFCLSKSYKNLPTKNELIDDFASLDILEQQPPIDFIRNDLGTIPIYPTAKEHFK